MKKKVWIWMIKNVYGGDPAVIAAKAKEAGYTDVYVKVADAGYKYNITKGVDLVPGLVEALRVVGIKVWGWHYIYGNSPKYEAAVAIQRIKELALDGYILDAESEFKRGQSSVNAAEYICKAIKNACPNTPLAVSSFRFPQYHPEFAWEPFMKYCDYNFPQVYWIGATNAGHQLEVCIREFKKRYPKVQIEPAGGIFFEHNWKPSASEVIEFLKTAEELNLPAVSMYAWDEALRNTLDVWKVFEDYKRPISVPEPEKPPVDGRIEAAKKLLADGLISIEKSKISILSALDSLKN